MFRIIFDLYIVGLICLVGFIGKLTYATHIRRGTRSPERPPRDGVMTCKAVRFTEEYEDRQNGTGTRRKRMLSLNLTADTDLAYF